MAYYLFQVAYTSKAWKDQVKKPQNRVELVKPIVEKLGGKILGAWLSFGEFDIVVILEMPDNVSQATFAIAGAASGHLKAVKTTPLISMDEKVEALRRVESLNYPI